MKRLLCLAAILLLVAATFPASVLAVNNTPEEAIVLTAQNAGHSDRLVGDTGGAVRFYRIDYAGGGQPVKIDVTTIPGRDTMGPRIGFKLYGPDGFVGEAPVEQNEPTWTRFSMMLVSVTPGAYLIQVYNFTDGGAVDFNIQASGITDSTTGTPDAGSPGGTADQPVVVAQPTINIGGSLVGMDGGNHQYFSFDYPGGSTSTNIELKYSPPSPFQNGAVGFNLYNGSDLVAQGSEIQRDGNGATVSYTLADDAGRTYVLQVFNYEPGFPVNYVLTVSGAAGRVQQVTDNTVPERAFVLTPQIPAARGSIGPGAEATFNFFLVNYPGNNVPVTVRLTVDQLDGIFDKFVGFNLYKGAELAGQAMGTPISKGDKRVASFTITEESAATFGIQVFNYSTTAPARYTIYVTGLQ